MGHSSGEDKRERCGNPDRGTLEKETTTRIGGRMTEDGIERLRILRKDRY